MTRSKLADNSKRAAKAKPRGKPWPEGVSGNPAGAPKRGESWAEVIKDITDKTPEEVLAELDSGELAAAYRKFPRHVLIKRLIIMRVVAALMFEPQSGLLNSFMERADGKVLEQLNLTVTQPAKIIEVSNSVQPDR